MKTIRVEELACGLFLHTYAVSPNLNNTCDLRDVMNEIAFKIRRLCEHNSLKILAILLTDVDMFFYSRAPIIRHFLHLLPLL